MHGQVDTIQISTHNICLYKEVKKKYTGCNLKTTELLDCALIRVCAVIRLNTVCCGYSLEIRVMSTHNIICFSECPSYLEIRFKVNVVAICCSLDRLKTVFLYDQTSLEKQFWPAINPFMSSGLFCHNSLDQSVSKSCVSG